MGNVNNASTPSSVIIRDITRDNIGLLIKVSTIKYVNNIFQMQANNRNKTWFNIYLRNKFFID